MKQQVLITCFVLFSSLISVQLLGQEHQEEEEVFVPHHALGLVISHAHVFSGLDASGHRKVLSLPSWGVDYTYHVSEKWALGLHTDIITETFEVEKNLAGGSSGEVLERSHPVAPAVMTIYKPNHHWNLLFGIGMEFAKEENLFLNRLGAEYSAEIRGGFEVFGSLGYDFKWNAYDTWVLGIGIAKSFGHRSRQKTPHQVQTE